MCELDIGQTVTIYNSVRARSRLLSFYFYFLFLFSAIDEPIRSRRDTGFRKWILFFVVVVFCSVISGSNELTATFYRHFVHRLWADLRTTDLHESNWMASLLYTRCAMRFVGITSFVRRMHFVFHSKKNSTEIDDPEIKRCVTTSNEQTLSVVVDRSVDTFK